MEVFLPSVALPLVATIGFSAVAEDYQEVIGSNPVGILSLSYSLSLLILLEECGTAL